ncbi:Cobalt/magnesium transport protein CorA [bacterium HR23]|nr:Cobalt/magnesium transport protein CorA [bacterium HR23]
MTTTGLARLEVQSVTWKGLTWVNVERPTMAEMEYLRARFNFHPLALDDCLSRVQLPKVDEFDDHIFLVLHFPLFSKQMRLTLPSQVAIFAGASYVVTVHRGELKPLVKLFADCVQSEAVRDELMARSSGYLLYRILDVLVDYCFPILGKIMEQVDDIEHHLFERQTRAIAERLSFVRRDIIAFRRIIRPQIAVMELLERREYPFLKVDPDVYYGDLADHTRRIWAELEELREVTQGLNETLFTLSSQLSNDALRILTVIFTALLPITIIGTLYGMNVHLPLANNAHAFWIATGAGALLGLAMWVWFRLNKWV